MGIASNVAKELIPPDHDASPGQQVRWRWVMFGSVIGAIGLGWFSLIQIDDVRVELSGVKDSIVCSELKGQIERNRADKYEIEREIEVTNGQVTERVRMRLDELINTLSDNELKFEALGCVAHLA